MVSFSAVTSMAGLESNSIFFLLSFITLGAGIKLIDDAFDEDMIDRRIALFLSPLIAILWVFTMILNISAATVLFAIVLGVFFTKKVDNKAHLTGFLLIVAGALLVSIEIFPYLTALLTLIAVLDEKGNDYTDENSELAERGILGNFAYIFLFYRFGMKLTVLFAVIWGTLDWFIFPAFLGFDIGYHLVDKYGEKLTSSIRGFP